jgi:hypothetical protein
VLVPEGAQGLNRGASGFEVAYPGDHVDDALGGEAWHRGRANVVDASLKPRTEHLFEGRPFVSIPRRS